jgi:hypothetical protein
MGYVRRARASGCRRSDNAAGPLAIDGGDAMKAWMIGRGLRFVAHKVSGVAHRGRVSQRMGVCRQRVRPHRFGPGCRAGARSACPGRSVGRLNHAGTRLMGAGDAADTGHYTRRMRWETASMCHPRRAGRGRNADKSSLRGSGRLRVPPPHPLLATTPIRYTRPL